MDVNTVSRADWERRRKIRLAQVRDQSKILAKTIRDRVLSADEVQSEKRETSRNITEQKFKSLALKKLKSDFKYLIQDVGNGYAAASIQPDPSIVLAEKRLINRCTAISRGIEAVKRQQRIQEEQQMDKAMRESKTNFNKTVEKIRSKLITSIPNNVDHSSNHIGSNTKQNECLLIPSKVILNESNFESWNFNKKTSKPWSVVFNTDEKHMAKIHQPPLNDDNKENVLHSTNLNTVETEMKNYESLVTKLNKLSAEEQNIRNKLFTNYHKEDPVEHKITVPSVSQENHQHSEIIRVQHIDKTSKSNKIIKGVPKNKFEPNSSFYISSSASNDECLVETIKKHKKTTHFKNKDEKQNVLLTSSNFNAKKKLTREKHSNCIIISPAESTKKTIHLKNKEDEKNAIQSSSKLNQKKKLSAEKPLKSINNTVQRIKKKKQLLMKEISTGSNNIKTDSSTPEIPPVHKRCKAGNCLLKVSPTNYAKLPDSFYDQLSLIKKQFSEKKSKHNNTDYNSPINTELMEYINTLLKMTPSDIDNLSISSCSSIKLEESVLCSSKNEQYYSEILNCISKCLNVDISDLSENSVIDSPKNINFLNRLQNLTNYYLDKTREMKNICQESPPNINNQNTEAETEINNENNPVNISSDSSVDDEYILGHLNTILKKKGLIRSDKEWPMFDNFNDDDNRSLTDQLLDVYPRRSYDS